MDLTYPLNLRKDLRISGDTAYYINLINAEPFFWDICEFDENHVPKVNYGPEKGIHYNKTFICQFALAHLNAFLDTCDRNHLTIYENQLEWLNSNIELRALPRSAGNAPE